MDTFRSKKLTINRRWEQLTLRSAAVREELHTELERMLNDIIKFKIHVQGSLEAYEDFVAQEVERECQEQEMAESAALEEQAELDGQMDEMEE
jgi:kinetochore protein NDC80